MQRLSGAAVQTELGRAERREFLAALEELELDRGGRKAPIQSCSDYFMPERKLGISVCAFTNRQDFAYGQIWHGTANQREHVRWFRSKDLLDFV